MKKVMSVIGTRPQFIKLAAVAHQLEKEFEHIIINTGQHYDFNMAGAFIRDLDIPEIAINLCIHEPTHGAMIGRMLMALECMCQEHKPDLVLVYGDTNSTVAAALAANKMGIPVGHVEAGLRSFTDMPEEINRKLTDHISDILFCPTLFSIKSLQNEGIDKKIVLSGDVMYELLHNSFNRIRNNTHIIGAHDLFFKNFYLVTAHRASTVDNKENLEKLIDIICSLPEEVVFPMHPRTKKMITKFGLWNKLDTQINKQMLKILDPLSYLDVLSIAYHAKAVLTDSGGLQKEALFLGTPVLVLRNETEWVETLNYGNHLVGLNKEKILFLLSNSMEIKKIEHLVNNITPSQYITETIKKKLGVDRRDTPKDNPTSERSEE